MLVKLLRTVQEIGNYQKKSMGEERLSYKITIKYEGTENSVLGVFFQARQEQKPTYCTEPMMIEMIATTYKLLKKISLFGLLTGIWLTGLLTG